MLGRKVKDVITGFSGVVIAKTEYLNGCISYCLQPTELKDNGTIKELEWFDSQRLGEAGITGGPGPVPPPMLKPPK